MKLHRVGAALLGGLAALVLLACPTMGGGRGGAGNSGGAGELPGSALVLEVPQAGGGAGGGPAGGESPVAASLVEALYQACGELSGNIPDRASIAVISIASGDPAEGEFAVEELTLLLVNVKKYSIVDRRHLELIRAEQRFQLSGEVDDDTAVSIGRLMGAAMVITGSISPYHEVKYLRLKALDVETGEIRAMASRRFNG
ncbi:CsgG/HfaB family protein [Treponema sp. TIM-1]|uniref:CsgG/HfaB family protein n=1 Tax=Treponema sp. TIM-1 TaxID=2898417 RepID=UPI003980A599